VAASAPAVVIGGGVGGCSIAYWLSRLGWDGVVLLERADLTSGSTFHSAGLVGQLRGSLSLTRMMMSSVELYRILGDEVGLETGWREVGSLRLASSQERMEELARQAGWAKTFGLPLELVSAEEAQRLFPPMATEGVLGAAYLPSDGYVDPSQLTFALAEGARRRGAEIRTSTRVTGIRLENGRVAGVETARGRIATDCVVLTAGVWSRELAATAGFSLPVEPERRFMHVTGEAPDFPKRLPLTVDFSSSFYFHREGEGILFGGAELDELAPVAARRLPALAELDLRHTISGFYEMSPDHNALIGAAPDPAGLVYATGFSGHGFQQGLVVGEHLAQLALGLEPTFDLSQFDAERFARGTARAELNVI